jgi:Rieske Fe-S protein
MNRRQWLGALLGGAAGIGLGAGGSCLWSLSRDAEATPLVLGHLSDLSDDGIRDFTEHGVAVLRHGQQLLFLASRCTHLGCKLRLSGREWVCPCHGGRFKLDGERLAGPPRERLARLRGEVGPSGELLVYRR